MSVRKRPIKKKEGVTIKWEASVMLGDGERIRRMFDTKGEASKFETETRHSAGAGTFRKETEAKTLESLLIDYLLHLRDRLARKEIVFGYVTAVRSHVENYLLANSKSQRHPNTTHFTSGLGHIKLRALTRGTVEDFKERLRTSGVSVANTRAILKSLHSALDYAQARDLVYANRCIHEIGHRGRGGVQQQPPVFCNGRHV